LEPAKGKVILTISGKVGEKNSPDAAVFDLAMLEKLPQAERLERPGDPLAFEKADRLPGAPAARCARCVRRPAGTTPKAGCTE